jgi:hypothetical protein
MIIYLVGDCGPDHNSLQGAYKLYGDAMEAFQELRLDLLNGAKSSLEYWKERREEESNAMYERMIKNLSEEDPEKIDNYPHETPYIREIELK